MGDMQTGRSFGDFSEEHAQGDLLPRIVEVALASADVVVAADGVDRLTGAQLLRRAAAVREAVLAADPGGRPVAVLRGHDVGAVAAIVGVIAAGVPVVVLDPTTPAPRLRHYVEAAGATVCVSDSRFEGTAREVVATVLQPDGDPAALPDHLSAASSLLGSPARPDDTAVIVYTSGSTGAPKGVACDHRSILHDTWVNSVGTGCYGAGSVVVHLLPMAFSAGIGVTLACLLSGARQELFDPRRRSVAELPAWMRQVGADVLLASPAILRGAITTLGPGGRLEGLRSLTVAGETVHGGELAAIRRAVGPDCVLRNRYGSTETWLMTEYALTGDDPAPDGATPVGWAVPGARLHVELPDGTLADRGTGRVVLTSRWLGAAYWNAPERTAESFTDHPDGTRSFRTSDIATLGADGCLRLVGRTDDTVKIRGLLVEPGEVEALLYAQPDVREARVVGQQSPTSGRMRLVAFVVWTGPRPSASAIRELVRSQLPAHMVPEHVEFLTALPRTERGKVDRSQFPLVPDNTGSEPPRNDFENVVTRMFEKALGVSDLGADADFFAAGGDSLAAEALLATITAELGLDQDRLSTADLVANPTPRALSSALKAARSRTATTLVALRGAGGENPLFCVAGAGGVALSFRPLVDHLPTDLPVWGLQAKGLETWSPPDWSVRAIARRNVALIRSVRGHGPYRLAGFSFGGLVALEMAQQLTSAGEEVELLALLDSFPPDPSVMPPAIAPGVLGWLRGAAAVALTGSPFTGRRDRYERYYRQSMLLQRRYRTSTYHGRALVVVADGDPDTAGRSRWAEHLGGDWSSCTVPGDHLMFLREPVVAVVADAVARALSGTPDTVSVVGPRSATGHLTSAS